MTDYVKATDFASKDALLSGNPAKVIKGTEIDTEYNAIAVAVATKADLVSPAFTGTPAAPTATGGTNTTQIATTAFVKSAVDAAMSALYPVGSIYTNATNSTNPGTLLGFGTWTAFGAGRVMVGFNASDPLFDTAEETGGSKDAIVVSHTHTATTTITDPGHSHTLYTETAATSGGAVVPRYRGITQQNNTEAIATATTGITVSTSVDSTGSSGTNANLQPYITVYLWKRTA